MTPNRSTPSVLILVSSNRRRGAEVFGETLANGLADAGWRVEFASLAAAASGPVVSATPLSPNTPDTLGKLDRNVIAAVRSAVKQHTPDLVLANGSSTMQYAVAALRWWRRRPRLVYVSIGEPAWWIRDPKHRLLRTVILKGIDRVFSVSATTAKQLVDQLGVPQSKIRIAPTGVPRKFFHIPAGEPMGNRPLRVVFIGNLSAEKGPLVALDVIDRVASTHPIEARFLGDGPQRADLERTVSERNLADRVSVVGSVPDVGPHLEWADVLLMTSQTEGLPGVPLEAGAAGVPSVVFDVGGSRETVVHGDTGYVVPFDDRSAAASALASLADDPATLATMGTAAREHVRSNFTLEGAVARYVTLLNDELEDTRTPTVA